MSILVRSALLSAALLFSFSSAMAQDGTAKLNFTGLNVEYDAKLTENHLTGFSFNIGFGTGNIDLKKENGEWLGRFGMNTVGTTAIEEGGDGKASFSINVLPAGNYQVNIDRNKKTMNISMPHLIRGWASISPGNVSASNEFVTMNLRSKDASILYTGNTNFIKSNGMYYPVYTELYARGDLDPIRLFDEDPALFAILYFLPISYVR